MPQGNPDYKGVWFVSEKRQATNELVIVKGGNHPSLFNSKVLAENWTWIDEKNVAKAADMPYHIQYRSLQFPLKVKAIVPKADSLEIELEEKARAMAPGQNLVLYKDSQVLGSGVIKRAFD